MTTDTLEERLRSLAIEVPDAGRVSARVLGRLSKRHASRVPRVTAAFVAAVVLIALVAYFVPAADTAIAKVPFGGELLRDAGLVGAGDRITSVGSSATASGYRLTLVGAYADSSRTVLLMHADPAIANMDSFITDQFGRSYHFQNGATNSETGDLVAQFEGLAWPDAITGARITLHVMRLRTTGPDVVSGSWQLPATLGVDEGTRLPLPPGASLGPAHFSFTEVSYTPATVAIDMDISGVSFQELNRRTPDGLKGTPAFEMDLTDQNGDHINGAYESGGGQGPIHVHFVGYRLGGGGRYTFRVTYSGETFERQLNIG